MAVDQRVYRRRAAILLFIFLLVTCTVAEEGVLVLIVTDTGQHPFANLRIGTAGDGGSPQTTDQNGKARLRLAPSTKPNTWVTLLIGNAPAGVDVVFISPYDNRVRVPPFDNEQENYDPVVLAKRSDRSMLESGSGMLAIHATVNRTVAAQKKKSTKRTSQDYRRHPASIASNPPHLRMASLRAGSSAPDYEDPQPRDEELQRAALAVAAQAFGLPVEDIQAAIANWGGDALVWGQIMLTASIEAGGTDPFPFVRAANQDIRFGSGSWSLRDCSLQPVLLKFQQRDRKRFAQIIGADSAWLSKTMSAPCEASAQAALQRMLDASGHLSPLWRSRFRNLGNERSFQHLQVQQVETDVATAKKQATALGLQSDQAFALLNAPAVKSLLNAAPAFGDSYLQDVAIFTRQNGRPPSEQEKLLHLKDKIIGLWKEQPGNPPEATATFVSLVSLFNEGSGTVLGRQYDLGEFGILVTNTPPVAQPKSSVPTAAGLSAPNQCDPSSEQQLLDLMNQERAKQGIPPLQVDPRLNQAAAKHTAIMVAQHELSHQFDGEPPIATRFSNENLLPGPEGENIGYAPNVAAEHENLMQSSDHRANILNPDYNVVGMCAVRSGGELWVTQDFARIVREYSASQADAAIQEAIDRYVQGQGMPSPPRKPQERLRDTACDMARNGALDRDALAQLPGVDGILVWDTSDPAALPAHAREWLSKPLPSGYSLGACFAPSTSHPEGTYWVVMVTYR